MDINAHANAFFGLIPSLGVLFNAVSVKFGSAAEKDGCIFLKIVTLNNKQCHLTFAFFVARFLHILYSGSLCMRYMMRYIISIIIILTFISPFQRANAHQTKECTVCHVSHNGGAVKKPLTELCVSCHPKLVLAGNHKVEINPQYTVFQNVPLTPVPQNIPLTKEGKITCITCHDQHSQKSSMLRMEYMVLCNSCHNKQAAVQVAIINR